MQFRCIGIGGGGGQEDSKRVKKEVNNLTRERVRTAIINPASKTTFIGSDSSDTKRYLKIISFNNVVLFRNLEIEHS